MNVAKGYFMVRRSGCWSIFVVNNGRKPAWTSAFAAMTIRWQRVPRIRSSNTNEL